MVLDVYGIVKHKGKVLAIGDNGRFETSDERTINILKSLGYKGIPAVAPKQEPMPEQRKQVRPKTSTKEKQ